MDLYNHLLDINKNDFLTKNKNILLTTNLFDLNKINKLINKTNFIVDKTNFIVDKSNFIINKVDIILTEWFKYDLLNRSNNIISQFDNLTLQTLNLINDTKYTVKLYYKIGDKILNYIDNGIYILIILIVVVITTQTVIVLMLCCIYKNNIYKTKTNNVRMINVK